MIHFDGPISICDTEVQKRNVGTTYHHIPL
jgi:hypothetical protein